MKLLAALCLLFVGISGLPQQSLDEVALTPERFSPITDLIITAIEDVSYTIKDMGLDPLRYTDSGTYSIPVPVIFTATGVVEELHSDGLSNIVINDLRLGIIGTRLYFDIELPHIDASIRRSEVDVTFFGEIFKAQASGSFSISNIRVAGMADIYVGIISGIAIRELEIDLSVGDIKSDLNVVVHGYDLSSQINTFLGTTVPTTLTNFKHEIDELIELVALPIINDLL